MAQAVDRYEGPVRYKVVELSLVTDEAIEDCLNTWIAKGYTFEEIRFVVREGSRRPSMAFVFFFAPRDQDADRDA